MNSISKALPVLTFFLTGSVLAAGAPVSHQFQGGQAASATQVNENFQELADRIDAIPAPVVATSYDYRQFLSSVSTKSFSIRGNSTCDAETLTYARTPNGANTTITIARTATNSGAPCFEDIQYFNATPTQYEHTAGDRVDINAHTITDHYRYTPAEVIALNAMQPGQLYSFHSEMFYTPYSGVESSSGFSIRDISAITVEDVTVPAGTFTGCLKIRRNHYSNTNASRSMVWRCPTLGEVKYIYVTSTNGYTIKELTAYTP